jgi:hypothetical protein
MVSTSQSISGSGVSAVNPLIVFYDYFNNILGFVIYFNKVRNAFEKLSTFSCELSNLEQ